MWTELPSSAIPLGGGIALQFWYLFPDRVNVLVMVSSGGLGREVGPLLRSAALPGSEWVFPIIASAPVTSTVRAAGRVLSALGWTARPELSEACRGFASLSDGETRQAFLATLRAVIDPGGQTVTARDHFPPAHPVSTLIVWGSEDRIIPASHASAAAALIPGSRLELFEGAGHFPHLDQPDRFTGVLRRFIAAGPHKPAAIPSRPARRR